MFFPNQSFTGASRIRSISARVFARGKGLRARTKERELKREEERVSCRFTDTVARGTRKRPAERRYSKHRAKSRGNRGISSSSRSSKNPDNFTAKTRAIYGRVFVAVAELLSRAYVPLRDDANSGRSWLLAKISLYVFRSNIDPRVLRRLTFRGKIECAFTYVRSSLRTRAVTPLVFERTLLPFFYLSLSLSRQRYKFPCALRVWNSRCAFHFCLACVAFVEK